ncbi:Transcriptional regulatory protein, C terminal [Serratia quinivorans]|uniref:winged helix-turn-helix domain-containing protein n=1 Tax=Serratia quinivorans TaxID=137545 RepID=UPI00217C160F|nr:winged helix-turn-helix domain-containing protein [Serratia quinivorans]CAI1073186.1 Transcriptional regulatory protein, C terminal [Serratia quinivorans]
MLGKYIINDQIIFDPEERTLVLAREQIGSASKLTLHTPTSHCLALLIERRGEVLSQDELLDLIWRKKGIVVSPSTVYQNISLLRRSFNQLGLYDEVIITIPRQGVTLSRHIIIKEQTEVTCPSELSPAPPLTHTEPFITQPLIELLKDKNKLPGKLIIAFATLAALCTIVYFIGQHEAPDYLESYDLTTTALKHCQVFVNDDMPTGKLDQIVKNSTFNCAERPFNYVTAFAGVNRYSVISCAQSIGEARASCRSYFYLESAK